MRFGWSGDYNSPKTFLDIFRSGDEQNLSGYSNLQFDQLLQSGARETDALANANIMQAAELKLVADQPVIPLYFYVSKHMVSPDIRGFEANAVDRHPSRFLSFGPSD
jgi:oligopeptide transport system substrate-binding protein